MIPRVNNISIELQEYSRSFADPLFKTDPLLTGFDTNRLQQSYVRCRDASAKRFTLLADGINGTSSTRSSISQFSLVCRAYCRLELPHGNAPYLEELLQFDLARTISASAGEILPG